METTDVKLTIDGRAVAVAPGSTLLQAARAAGIDDIPTLCHDERLHPYGSCFLCVVEVPGTNKLFPACATEVRPGMVVQTRSERVVAARKRALELLLSDHYADCLGPCRMACPAGVDIQGYVALVAAGRWLEAARLIRERNPLPAVCGRVCVRKCEVACRRSEVDGAVGINMIKRYATDRVDEAGARAALQPQVAPPSGHRAAVIGAGPAGLACADLLIRRGHAVTVFEANPEPGGMLRYGIPEYRLPRAALDRDIQGVLELGVQLRVNQRLGRDFTLEGLKGDGYEAIFLGLGAQGGSPMKVRGEELAGVRLGVDFLRENELVGHPALSGRVVVVGGGNTAIDCARTALRCGADEVELVYRRTRAEMPANAEEIEAALHEGVKMTFLAAPVEVVGGEGRVSALRCCRMELGEPDKSGRRRPVAVAGSEYDIPCAHLLAAIGQQVDLDGLQDAHAIGITPWKTVVADEQGLATGMPGVFAGGDVVLGPAVAIDAIAQGRRAGAAMDRFLTGAATTVEPGFVSRKDTVAKPSPAQLQQRIDQLGATQPRTPMPERHLDGLGGDWKEVELRLDEQAALQEAHRCLSCGCTDFFTCDLRRLATEYGANLELTRGEVSRHEVDRRHPHLELDANKCVLCAKCIRVCESVLGGSVLGLVQRGFATLVAPTMGRALQDTGCIACGACVDVCPTGAIADRGTQSQRGPWQPDWQPFVCTRCGLGCELEADRTGGQVQVRPKGGAAAPIGSICERGRYGQVDQFQSTDRLTTPQLRGDDGLLHPAGWPEALARAAAGLAAARDAAGGRVGVFAAPRLSNEAAYLAAKLARAGCDSDWVGSLAGLLTGAEHDELDGLWGHTASTATLAELQQAELILLCNADPLVDQPVLGLAIRQALRRGARLIGLGPTNLGARLARGASEALGPWLDVRRGGGLGAALGWMAHHLIDQGGMLAAGRGGLLPGVLDLEDGPLARLSASEVARRTGVAPAKLEELARLVADPTRRLVAVYDPERAADRAPGQLQALAFLLAVAGRTGQAGSGLLLPSGHVNSRGMIDAGLAPGRLPGRRSWADAADRQALVEAWGRLPAQPQTPASVRRALVAGDLPAMLLLDEDPVGDPRLTDSFVRPQFLVVATPRDSATARTADVVLPWGGLLESEGTVTSCDRTVRPVQALVTPLAGPTSLQLLADLAHLLGVAGVDGPALPRALYRELATVGRLYPLPLLAATPWTI